MQQRDYQYQTNIIIISSTIPHLSYVALVVLFIALATLLWVVIRLLRYSCNEDWGDRSFEITQASKKFAFDSHRDNSLVSFWLWSGVATTKKNRIVL